MLEYLEMNFKNYIVYRCKIIVIILRCVLFGFHLFLQYKTYCFYCIIFILYYKLSLFGWKIDFPLQNGTTVAN